MITSHLQTKLNVLHKILKPKIIEYFLIYKFLGEWGFEYILHKSYLLLIIYENYIGEA